MHFSYQILPKVTFGVAVSLRVQSYQRTSQSIEIHHLLVTGSGAALGCSSLLKGGPGYHTTTRCGH